jgi:hypothetical protein
MTEEKLLTQGIAILTRMERSSTDGFFAIGVWMYHWKKVRGYKSIQACGVDAAMQFGKRGFAFDYHWYSDAYRAVYAFNENESHTLVVNAVPVSDVRALLCLSEDRRKEWILRIKRRDLVAPFGIRKAIYGKRTPKNRVSVRAAPEDANEPSIEILPFDGGEFSETRVVDGLASLISRIGMDRFKECERKAFQRFKP